MVSSRLVPSQELTLAVVPEVPPVTTSLKMKVPTPTVAPSPTGLSMVTLVIVVTPVRL